MAAVATGAGSALLATLLVLRFGIDVPWVVAAAATGTVLAVARSRWRLAAAAGALMTTGLVFLAAALAQTIGCVTDPACALVDASADYAIVGGILGLGTAASIAAWRSHR